MELELYNSVKACRNAVYEVEWSIPVDRKESDMCNVAIKMLVLFVIAVPSGQAMYGDVNELAAESLAVYKRAEEVGARKKDATREQTKRIAEIRSRLKELRPEIVQKYNSQIEQYTEQIEQLKKKIAQLQGKIEAVGKADPDETKAEEKRLSGELDELRAAEQRLAKPFDEQIAQAKRVSPEKKAAYKKAMEKYCLIPGKEYAEVAGISMSASFGGTIISYQWKDAKGKHVAWAHLRLRDKPAIPLGAVKLDDTYLVFTHSDGSIWVWAGHFQICFVMNKKEWQGKANVAEAVKAFIDMKGLAEIDAAPKARKN